MSLKHGGDMETCICDSCGASVPVTDSLCRYCKSPVRQGRELTEAENERLKSIANAMEETLKEAENSSWVLGICFILLGAGSIGSYFAFSALTGSAVKPVVFSIITAMISFLVFGVVVGIVNDRTLKRIYNNDVKLRINEYLQNVHLNRYEFDFIADRTLPKKALLRRFLFRP